MKLRKKFQREINRRVRYINKELREDELWLGRFEIRQKRASYYQFEDKSGGILFVTLRMVDKSTGYYKDVMIDAPYQNHHIWWKLNKFISEDSGAWDNGRPEPIDCRDERISDELMKLDYNWFVSAKYFEV